MLWVLWDIVLPLVATFLLGLFIGWMLWRWRRSRIDVDNISELRRASSRYRADAERLQQSNIELSDRLQAASGAGGGELASARKRIDMLGDELKVSRREVAELKTANTKTAGKSSANNNTSTGESDLLRQIESRDRMIATLKRSLDQFGENSDATALMADIALRDRKIDALENLLEGQRNKNT